MLPKLNDTEARLIGCLMEKSVTTPTQMPLTLNALVNAANQTSAREPVMSLNPTEAQQAARALAARSLVHIDENFKTGVEKYRQRLCGSGPFVELKLTQAQFAIVTLLLLRGPQTPGELRARAGRLHEFADNHAVVAAARELIEEDNPENSLLVQLPRTRGRKDAEFMHQLCGPVDLDAVAAAAGDADRAVDNGQIAALKRRIDALEAENAGLRKDLEILRRG